MKLELFSLCASQRLLESVGVFRKLHKHKRAWMGNIIYNMKIELLREKFPDCVVSRNSDIHCFSRSYTLTLTDFFLWCFVKEQVLCKQSANYGIVQRQFKELLVTTSRICWKMWWKIVLIEISLLQDICVAYIIPESIDCSI